MLEEKTEAVAGKSDITVRNLLALTREKLLEAGIEDAVSESFLLLEWICGIDRTTCFAEPDTRVSPELFQRFLSVLKKRTERIPLQYLMNSCEFMGYSFFVDERVLIPRQDTECLVEEAVRLVKSIEERDCLSSPVRVLDLCTGSGCIGISIKKLCPGTDVTLTDISGEALSVARYNACNLDAQMELVQGDLFENIDGQFNFIISNPPYIPTKVIDILMPEVRDHEPRLALDGEEDGLYFYRRILHEAAAYLAPGGFLIMEIGMDQGEDLQKLLNGAGYGDVRILKDLAGLDRIAEGRLIEK